MKVDWLIVGAGFTGLVVAERIASQLGKKVLVVERRDHIGGNAYDHYDANGILVHRYGPHLFHTNSEKVWRYLSRFTEWRPYHHKVLAQVDGKKVPIPFNLNSLHALFSPGNALKLEELLLKHYGSGNKVPILKLRREASGELHFLAEYIYEKVFYGYNLKQWGLSPEELGPGVSGRVPVHISRDDRYFQDRFQAVPKHGYTRMFQRMANHPNIKLLLNADYREIEDEVRYDGMVYTGLIDEFFEYMHGELPYRSLRFEFSYHSVDAYQEVAQLNYPNEHSYTRISEYKHITGQRAYGTTVSIEYPEAYRREQNLPYYPVPREENRKRYNLYLAEAESLKKRILFAGRLADYKYYNMDQAVARALGVFEKQVAPDAAKMTQGPRFPLQP
jgi:UDP-galactopyranose mutase